MQEHPGQPGNPLMWVAAHSIEGEGTSRMVRATLEHQGMDPLTTALVARHLAAALVNLAEAEERLMAGQN